MNVYVKFSSQFPPDFSNFLFWSCNQCSNRKPGYQTAAETYIIRGSVSPEIVFQKIIFQLLWEPVKIVLMKYVRSHCHHSKSVSEVLVLELKRLKTLIGNAVQTRPDPTYLPNRNSLLSKLGACLRTSRINQQTEYRSSCLAESCGIFYESTTMPQGSTVNRLTHDATAGCFGRAVCTCKWENLKHLPTSVRDRITYEWYSIEMVPICGGEADRVN